jgi:DNA-directed RNA polymerase subunit L
VSQLRKCLRVSEEQIPLEELTIGEDHTYQEYLVKILVTSEKVTQNNRYKMCKVQWSNHTEEEATWKKEDQLKAEFLDIFSNMSESRG